MLVELVLSDYLILNRIQTLCLFKGPSLRLLRIEIQQPHASIEVPTPPLSSPLSSPLKSQCPKLGHPLPSTPIGVWESLLIASF